MTRNILHTTLGKIVDKNTFGYIYNIENIIGYRNFYHIYPGRIKTISKITLKPVQHALEKLRPTIDYIVLPDTSILVGATEDFADMKKAALELMMQRLVNKQKESLKYHEDLLQTVQFYQTATPFTSIYPELFI